MPAEVPADTGSAFHIPPPSMSADEIRRVLQASYGIEADVRPLTSERDLTAHVLSADGREFTFKVANASEDRAIIAFQNDGLDHVAIRAPGLPVPALVRSLGGERLIEVTLAGRSHAGRLLTYLQGVPLHRTRSTPAQRRALGAALAQLARALSDFTHPASGHHILWDLKHAGGLRGLTPHIEDGDRRSLVEDVFERFQSRIKPLEASLRHQVVHNDLNPHNVLAGEDDSDRIAGILDFGDMVRTPLIYDVAVACSYLLSRTGHPLASIGDFLSAYHETNPLLEEEIDLLFDLIRTRSAMTVAITEWRSKRHPENRDYILRNNPMATEALRACAAVADGEARRILRDACGMG